MSSTNGSHIPEVTTTMDGAQSVVYVEAKITQGACAYPITSSSKMGEEYETYVADGVANLWEQKLQFMELESEHSAASTCEGFALAGGRVTNFTSGQGLILMKEVLYTISGKRLPIVFHIGARALTSHSLNVHAGHDDVMGVADCGWGMVFAKNAQEAGDFALISRRAAEDSDTPFFNVQDGFLTTHTIETVVLRDDEMMRQYIGKPEEKLLNLMDTANPLMVGVVQNQDSYMKGKIAQRHYYDQVPAALQNAMDEFNELNGTSYSMIEEHNMENAEYAIVAMGGASETAMATVDYMRDVWDTNVGVVNIVSFRPFPGPAIVEALKNVKAFSILERMDNPLAQSNPLTTEVKSAFVDAMNNAPGYNKIDRVPEIFSGAGGLGSRDIRPADFISMVENMRAKESKRFFVIGIKHDLALSVGLDPDVRPEGSFSMRGHSVGGFGSVSTNKAIATMVGELGYHVQAYPKYGSEKAGLPTTYYLTISREPIRTHSELNFVDFVPMNDTNAFHTTNPFAGLQEKGMIFLQTPMTDPQEVWDAIPANAQEIVRKKHIQVVALDTKAIALEEAPSPQYNQVMQGVVLLGIFLSKVPFLQGLNMTEEELFDRVYKVLDKNYGHRPESLRANLNCVKRGYYDVFEIPRDIIEITSIVRSLPLAEN